VCPKSADVVQAGNFGPIRVLAEYGTKLQKERYLARLLSGESLISVGHDRTGSRLRVTDLQTDRGRGRRRLSRERLQDLHHALHARRSDARLLRFAPGVAGSGSVLIDLKAPGVRSGQALEVHVRREWAQITSRTSFVSADSVVLKGGGFRADRGVHVERIGNAARSLALGR